MPVVLIVLSEDMLSSPVDFVVPFNWTNPLLPAPVPRVIELPLRSLLAIRLPLVLMLRAPVLFIAPPIVAPPLLPVLARVISVPEIVPVVLIELSEFMSTVPVDFVVPPS